jgi:uncharacterized protein (DUF305 family)
MAAAALVAATLAGCSHAMQTASASAVPSSSPRPSGPVQRPVNAADLHFMSGMIPHHAQAVLIAGWAPSHGASSSVQTLCERIVNAQRDEIVMMQNWLRDRGQPVPATDAKALHMMMNGMEHDMLMPGMLNDDELAQLDRARGTEWERLFLQDMIKHHAGAITMVDELLHSPGSAQDEMVFRFSTDVYADQTTEIARMTQMLNALGGAP